MIVIQTQYPFGNIQFDFRDGEFKQRIAENIMNVLIRQIQYIQCQNRDIVFFLQGALELYRILCIRCPGIENHDKGFL